MACLRPGRIVCMFSLNESVKGRSRKSSSGTSWLKQLGPVPSLTTRSLRDLEQSHLKTLCASVSLSVTEVTPCLPEVWWGSLPSSRAQEGTVQTTCTAAGRRMDWFVFQNRSQPCWHCEEQKSKCWVFREGLESWICTLSKLCHCWNVSRIRFFTA